MQIPQRAVLGGRGREERINAIRIYSPAASARTVIFSSGLLAGVAPAPHSRLWQGLELLLSKTRNCYCSPVVIPTANYLAFNMAVTHGRQLKAWIPWKCHYVPWLMLGGNKLPKPGHFLSNFGSFRYCEPRPYFTYKAFPIHMKSASLSTKENMYVIGLYMKHQQGNLLEWLDREPVI